MQGNAGLHIRVGRSFLNFAANTSAKGWACRSSLRQTGLHHSWCESWSPQTHTEVSLPTGWKEPLQLLLTSFSFSLPPDSSMGNPLGWLIWKERFKFFEVSVKTQMLGTSWTVTNIQLASSGAPPLGWAPEKDALAELSLNRCCTARCLSTLWFEGPALQEGTQETSRLPKFTDNTEEKQHSFPSQGF